MHVYQAGSYMGEFPRHDGRARWPRLGMVLDQNQFEAEGLMPAISRNPSLKRSTYPCNQHQQNAEVAGYDLCEDSSYVKAWKLHWQCIRLP